MSDVNLKMFDWIEEVQNSAGKLTAQVALLNFVVIHLVDKGGLNDISAVARDQLERLIGIAEYLAGQTDDPDCVSPLVETLRASLQSSLAQ